MKLAKLSSRAGLLIGLSLAPIAPKHSLPGAFIVVRGRYGGLEQGSYFSPEFCDNPRLGQQNEYSDEERSCS